MCQADRSLPLWVNTHIFSFHTNLFFKNKNWTQLELPCVGSGDNSSIISLATPCWRTGQVIQCNFFIIHAKLCQQLMVLSNWYNNPHSCLHLHTTTTTTTHDTQHMTRYTWQTQFCLRSPRVTLTPKLPVVGSSGHFEVFTNWNCNWNSFYQAECDSYSISSLTSHLTPHTSHLKPHTSHYWMILNVDYCSVLYWQGQLLEPNVTTITSNVNIYTYTQ